MPVQFENYTHSFMLGGKPVFAPNDRSRRIGEDIKSKVEKTYDFEPFFYHLTTGGHVAALHAHRNKEFFCKVDIENFFYSVSRNRVTRALREIGIDRAKHYGKWSSVKNPFNNPTYAVPYGFVQSPILCSLILSISDVGNFLRRVSPSVTVSVYVDDISLSSNSVDELHDYYDALLRRLHSAALPPNDDKCIPPTTQMEIFNCLLKKGHTEVVGKRKATFYNLGRSKRSAEAFEKYCMRVSSGNI